MKFGRLLVIKEVRVGDKNRIAYLCKCDCGNEKTILKENITSGRQVSCGCLNKEKAVLHASKLTKTHGMYKTRTYSIWSQMKRRCQTVSNGAFARYGAKGITVCDRWQNFENFLFDMGECPDGLTLDRIDSKGNYEPANCRWATWAQQANNRGNKNGNTTNNH